MTGGRDEFHEKWVKQAAKRGFLANWANLNGDSYWKIGTDCQNMIRWEKQCCGSTTKFCFHDDVAGFANFVVLKVWTRLCVCVC
jgi:hypothetical protein